MFWKNAFQFSWRFMGIFCSLLEFRLSVEFGDPRIFLLFGFSFSIGSIRLDMFTKTYGFSFFLFVKQISVGDLWKSFSFWTFIWVSYLDVMVKLRTWKISFIYLLFSFHYFYFDVFLPLILVLEFFFLFM